MDQAPHTVYHDEYNDSGEDKLELVPRRYKNGHEEREPSHDKRDGLLGPKNNNGICLRPFRNVGESWDLLDGYPFLRCRYEIMTLLFGL